MVEHEAHWVPAYGSADADEFIQPERHLTSLGRGLAAARDAVAETLALSRRAHDLVAAERAFAKERGLVM